MMEKRASLFVRANIWSNQKDRVPKSTEQFFYISEKTVNGLYQGVRVSNGVMVGVSVWPSISCKINRTTYKSPQLQDKSFRQ